MNTSDGIGGGSVGAMSVVAVVAAYLFGSVPWAYLIVRWGMARDIRQIGNGNVGARNVIRTSGLKLGMTVLLLDVLKGALAYLVCALLDVGPTTVYIAGAAVLVGHWFPIWLRGRGGVGQAAASGFFLVMWPLAGAVGVVVFLLALAVIRIWNAAFVIAAFVFIGAARWLGVPWSGIAFFVLMMLATLAKKLADEPRQKVMRARNEEG